MTELVVPYTLLLNASVAIAALVLFQLLVADAASILTKHVPGTAFTGDHNVLPWRIARTHANSIENLGVFTLLVVLALAVGADARLSGWAAWSYAGARAAHMVCYYADWRAARSVAFAGGLVAQLALLALVLVALA